jgi:hypothetical protein
MHLPYESRRLPRGLIDYRVKPGNDGLGMTYAAAFCFGGAKRW